MARVLATRGSQLALWQAEQARALLGEARLLTIESSGDRDQTTDLARFGRIGIFTAEVDRAVLDGRADVGVHSLKDMTTTLQDGVVLAGVPARGPVEDVLVSRTGRLLDELPAGATVGTGSMRRRAMLLAARPDLRVVSFRGNVDTRLAKIEAGIVDAAVLARAGLLRLGLGTRITEVLDTDRFLPATCQGIVGWTCRADDGATIARLAELRDEDAWTRALAERALLRDLQGGCNAPIGAHATIHDGELRIRARVLSIDGSRTIAGEAVGAIDEPEALGRRLAEELVRDGARALVDEARDTGTRDAEGALE